MKSFFSTGRPRFTPRGLLARQTGFSLVELIIVIVVITILAGVTVPAIVSWMPNYRLKAAARDLYSNMQRVKMEAVKRNTDVLIDFSPGTYNPSGKVGSYQIFVDDGSGGGTAGDGTRNGSEQILMTVNMPAGVSLVSANFSSNTTAGFTSRGLPFSSRFGNAKLRNNKSRWYKLTMSIAGNLRLEISSDDITYIL